MLEFELYKSFRDTAALSILTHFIGIFVYFCIKLHLYGGVCLFCLKRVL